MKIKLYAQDVDMFQMMIKCDVSFCTGYEKECKQTFEDCVWWDEKRQKCKLKG